MTLTKTTLVSGLLLFMLTMPVHAEPDGITSGKQLQAQAEKETRKISTADLKAMLDDELEMVLVDIRTKTEVQSMGGTIDATQNTVIARGWLEFSITRAAQNKDTPIVVYCGAGIRSPLAAKTLQDMGYTNVQDYSEGFLAWKKAGLPVK